MITRFYLPLLSTNAKHAKFGCHVTSLCQGLPRSAGSGGEDPENQVTKKIFLKQLSDYDERSINKSQSMYDEMSHTVVYLFSTPNLGNYQAEMTIAPLALKQSKLLKYFQ